MERHDNCGRYNGHVRAETQPGEEGPLVRAVVAGVGGFVGKEERGEKGLGKKRVGAVGAMGAGRR